MQCWQACLLQPTFLATTLQSFVNICSKIKIQTKSVREMEEVRRDKGKGGEKEKEKKGGGEEKGSEYSSRKISITCAFC